MVIVLRLFGSRFLPAEPSPQSAAEWPGEATRESRWAALKDVPDPPAPPDAPDGS
ncbi:hypothetical protein ACIBW9_20190 [Streptomyces sp. NPDC049541]|uniref:hypothetical protein n=1 Tax=Streptomyces sp. NPDC049541 TaxID=3365594 RepID=UPI00379EC93C